MRKHLFIVGLPRTGTKLVRDILQNSPRARFRIADETFFLGHLVRPGVRHDLKQFGDLAVDDNVEKLVRQMFAGAFRGTYWSMLQRGQSGISESELTRRIIDSDRSSRAIYSVLMESYPDVTPETTVGDKTPGNLYHVPTLFEWYPSARLIHTFRDPRAILASEWKKRAKAGGGGIAGKAGFAAHTAVIFLHVLMTWLYAARLHSKYQQKYGDRYCLLKFEDLVSQPEQTVGVICDFLGIEFDKEMLTPAVYDSSYSSGRDSVASGFDTDTLERWKEYLPRWMAGLMSLLTSRYLSRFGYQY